MICEKCKTKMNWKIEGNTQGWWCPDCGWNVITSYIDEIDLDMTVYSVFIKNSVDIDKEKIKFIAKTANVSFNMAKQILEKKQVCILKGKATEVKKIIDKLQELKIDFTISPLFKY